MSKAMKTNAGARIMCHAQAMAEACMQYTIERHTSLNKLECALIHAYR